MTTCLPCMVSNKVSNISRSRFWSFEFTWCH